MRHIVPLSGKDSLCTALVQAARRPDLPYEYMFNDVGMELPETYAWLDRVEQAQGWTIQRVGRDLGRIIDEQGFLPAPKARYCTRLAKIKPMIEWVGREDRATIYYGLRADEHRAGFDPTGTPNIRPSYPLQDLGIDLPGVWAILEARNLLPPSFHWQALQERVAEILDADLFLRGGRWESYVRPWERHILFAGRSRSNCFMCFFQSLYEYAWLYKAHPDLFERMCHMEEQTGAEGFTWRSGYHMRERIPRDYDRIVARRARDVARMIREKAEGGRLSDGESMLALTSCGLLCGK